MFLIIILLLLLILISYSKEKFNQKIEDEDKKKIKECEKIIQKVVTERELQLPDTIKKGKTKCFSCEDQIKNDLGDKYIRLGQPTKCFSCEKQLINKNK